MSNNSKFSPTEGSQSPKATRKGVRSWVVSGAIILCSILVGIAAQLIAKQALGGTLAATTLRTIDAALEQGLSALTPLGLYSSGAERINASRYALPTGGGSIDWAAPFNVTELERAALAGKTMGANDKAADDSVIDLGAVLDPLLPPAAKGPPLSIAETALGLPDAVVYVVRKIAESGIGGLLLLSLGISLAVIFFIGLPLRALVLLPIVATLICGLIWSLGFLLALVGGEHFQLPYATAVFIAALHRILNNTIEEDLASVIRRSVTRQRQSV